ncbi:MAG: hypothetical protein LUE27_11455 [Clostridia bacterium]|nr:hypothetical protein [Clostridia bacterium]
MRRIGNSYARGEVLYEELSIGDLFLFNESLHMKIININGKYDAVILDASGPGNLVFFKPSTKVTQVEGWMRINGEEDEGGQR